MENIDKNNEIEQVILNAIARYDLEVIPMDIYFLDKYNLKDLYYMSIHINTKYSPKDAVEMRNAIRKKIKEKVSLSINKQETFTLLNQQYINEGRRGVLESFKGNQIYFNTFKKLIKRKERDY